MFQMKKFEGFHLDYTKFTVVTVCLNPSCNWRVATTSRLVAWQIASEHEAQVHPEQDIARRALRVTRFKQGDFQH